MKDKTFTIGQIVQLTGVTPKQLRFWEQEDYLQGVEYISYGGIHHRRYSAETLEQIQLIKRFLDKGFTLQAASQRAQANKK